MNQKTLRSDKEATAVQIPKTRKISGFTLVELIVVVTILAILATIGFLALSGYSQDARDSAMKANVRSLQTAISSEAALTGNSPRYYVAHDVDYALSGAFAYVDGASVALTGGDVGSAPADSNYTAGKPDFKKLKLNPDKFKISASGLPGGTLGVIARATGFEADSAEAAYDANSLMAAGADFITAGASGRKRVTSYAQTAGISPATKLASVIGNFPSTGMPAGNVSGLLRAEPGSATNLTGALLDGGNAANAASSWDQFAGGVISLAHFDGRPDNGDQYRSQVGINLRMEGANGGTSFVDDAGNAVTAAWSAQTSSAQFKYGATSLLLDGISAFVRIPDSPSIRPGSGDFTVEWWVRTNWGSTTVTAPLASQYNTATAGEYILGFRSSVTWAWVWSSSYAWTRTINDNAWHHVAWVRSGTSTNNNKVYVDGTLDFQFTNNTDITGGNAEFEAGKWQGNSSSYLPWNLDDIRVTKGVARYSWAFVPSQIPTVSGTIFSDQKGLAVTVGGDAWITYDSPKFTGSAILDGTGDHLSWASNADFGFWTGDFTIEFFAKSPLSKYQTVLDMRPAESNGAYPYLGLGMNGNVTYYANTATRINAGAWAMTANAWAHVALSRASGTTRLYVDGVERGSWADSTNYLTAPLRIGRSAFASATGEDFSGQIDEFRVTKGTGRYSANFTVPASAYPNP